MKLHFFPALIAAVTFTAAAVAQEPNAAPAASQNPTQNQQGQGGAYGRRGGGFGGGMGGRGTMGTVTEVAADHYTIKTDAGDVYTVKLTSNTRIVKMGAGGGMRGQGGGNGGGSGQGEGQGTGGGMGRGNPMQELKPSDIKVGYVITANGDTDANAKTIAANFVSQMDPQRVAQIREMEANFGKTWLQGKVTAIDGTKITVTGALDNAPHTIVADENTTFRKRRDPVTLADIQVGDTIRADGAVKDGAFIATSVNVGGMMGGEGQGGGGRLAPQPQQ